MCYSVWYNSSMMLPAGNMSGFSRFQVLFASRLFITTEYAQVNYNYYYHTNRINLHTRTMHTFSKLAPSLTPEQDQFGNSVYKNSN